MNAIIARGLALPIVMLGLSAVLGWGTVLACLAVGYAPPVAAVVALLTLINSCAAVALWRRARTSRRRTQLQA